MGRSESLTFKFDGMFDIPRVERDASALAVHADTGNLWVITDDDVRLVEFTVKMGGKVIQVGTQKSPKAIDVTMTEGPNKGKVMLGIYEIDGDTLKACFDPQGKKRPTEFKSPPGSQNFVNVHKRVKK
jgi:uncharacterized protein (TIGR03067 family)